MTQPTVLISGAGIAGPSLGFWLAKSGYRVVIVEIAPGIRPGGQTVDLRGAGGDVVKRMGLMPQMRDLALEQHGVAWVAADGSRRAEMPVTAFDGNGLVSKLEILRGDLVDVLYQATKDSVEYRFNTRISALSQDDDGVDVTLADGSTLRTDLVVGADGPHSAVRGLVFGPESDFAKPLGGYNAWFTAPDTVDLDGWYLMYLAPGGLNASMRPTHDPATAKAGLAFASDPIEYNRHDLDEQRQILVERFAGAGWQCDALLAAAQEADDFYFDAFLQIHMPSWVSGRVALVGDAGYCASPLSGMGTSLALVGAYLLAGELGPAESFQPNGIGDALQRYQARMRPYVDKCQDIPNRVDRYAPNSATDIAINIAVMKWMQRWPIRPIASRLWFKIADSIALPDYSMT
ncbi:FAD-dependent monooxygenase [Mycolicibacterium sp. 120270]|uniref:FAD-dependent monooxygenase n=1 Tax=Mycolicibacterium sp. 120270 TaxID=3090600 RepID=UPI00299E7078|nr:FAD-dependent monooxygenase [Mycolicibacterium sp. 120270]MDX1882914.1 FAD-dependent monooxygenase [Mycolicibacterium sp. 120270]